MGTPIKKPDPVEVYRALQEFADEEIETLLLLMDKDLTQEILLRREEAKSKPEDLLSEGEFFKLGI
ncbi:MAG: hypothetical protein U9P49_10655 [Thermodesulfobacteriota bacterium]|nr:hypothetical protein [Thermodesulfobacteriota bacterium]